MKQKYFIKHRIKNILFLLIFSLFFNNINSQVKLLKDVKISDIALHFDGKKVTSSAINTGDDAPYDYLFGKNISAHGDCIKSYNEYVFMTWYKGGKGERNVMLSRYNTLTGTTATIEFPHKHNGFQNKPWIGESHNTIAVGVSPLDGTIHLLYDMHAYTRPSNGSLSKDYFRYSFSKKDIASVPDSEFTLSQFVKNNAGGYKHLSLNGGEDYNNFNALTYPQFFLNDLGDLFMYMREGGNNNGAYKFSKYDSSTSKWSSFTDFNILNARSRGQQFNWGLYGDIKYENGKMRIGYQRRSQNNNDKYQFQNGIYYAFSDNQEGTSNWKNYRGENFSLPLIDSDKILVTEPGDLVETTKKDQVYIVGGFDWTVTANEDVHFISRVEDRENGVTKNVHTYKRKNDTEFTTTTDFSGASAVYTSGDNVYIIGLNNNDRIFVERAKGGTNNFVKVYEQTSGKRFDHGRVHISKGILYYYLMEKKTGSAQPIYLEIIDLDINAEKKPLDVTLTSIKDNQTLTIGKNYILKVDAFTDNGIVTKVDFIVNGNAINSDTVAPFSTNWKPNSTGSYTIEAVGYSSTNEIVSSGIFTVNIEDRDFSDLTGDTYRIRNVATGKYLDSENAEVIVSDSPDGEDKEWEVYATGNFFNIDSKVRGVLRAAGNPFGTIINTTKAPPTADGDKIWSVIYNENDETYLFRAGTNRYLYNGDDDKVVYSTSRDDDRSKWTVESVSAVSLSVNNDELSLANSVKVYPNPSNSAFTISLNGFNKADIFINDVLGKLVYKTSTSKESIQINSDNKFKPGIYFISVFGNDKRNVRLKLIIK